MTRLLIAAAAGVLSLPSIGSAQRVARGAPAARVLIGVIRDSLTGRGLEDASIVVVGKQLGVMSKATGKYLLYGPPVTDSAIIEVRRDGYLSARKAIAPGLDTLVLSFSLLPGREPARNYERVPLDTTRLRLPITRRGQ
jgi:hypothetical protein